MSATKQERAKKPKRYVGKIEMKLDFIRVDTEVEDCRELFPLRDRIMEAVREIMKDHPYNGSFGTGVRRMPKGIVYKDDELTPTPCPGSAVM